MFGEIYEKDNLRQIIPYYDKKYDKTCIDMEDDFGNLNKYICENLFINLYIGSLPFEIAFKDNDHMNFSSDNIKYDTPIDVELQFCNPHVKFVVLSNGLLFKRIKKFPSYFISYTGVIYGVKRRMFIVPSYDKDGYRFIKLFHPETHKRCLKRIHRLVYEEFTGENLNEKFLIDHYDSVKSNNMISNLGVLDIQANTQKGFSIDKSLEMFSDDELEYLALGIKNGKTLESMEDKLHVSKNYEPVYFKYCTDIVTGKVHPELRDKYNFSTIYFTDNDRKRYNDTQIHEVCRLLSETNLTKLQISELTSVPETVVKSVYSRRTWKYISDNYDFSMRNVS